MSAPVRIQRRRSRGWRMPPNTVTVDRSTKWGNPYRYAHAVEFVPGVMTVLISAECYVRAFAGYACRKLDCNPDAFAPLVGKNLACWCPPDQPCHADVLLLLANQPAVLDGLAADDPWFADPWPRLKPLLPSGEPRQESAP